MLGEEEISCDLLTLESRKCGVRVCEGLGGPRRAGDYTGEGCACSYVCVDAQAGLGTGVPGPANSNVGTATMVTHRAEKQRLLECFIMEHSLTAHEHLQQQ